MFQGQDFIFTDTVYQPVSLVMNRAAVAPNRLCRLYLQYKFSLLVNKCDQYSFQKSSTNPEKQPWSFYDALTHFYDIHMDVGLQYMTFFMSMDKECSLL